MKAWRRNKNNNIEKTYIKKSKQKLENTMKMQKKKQAQQLKRNIMKLTIYHCKKTNQHYEEKYMKTEERTCSENKTKQINAKKKRRKQ